MRRGVGQPLGRRQRRLDTDWVFGAMRPTLKPIVKVVLLVVLGALLCSGGAGHAAAQERPPATQPVAAETPESLDKKLSEWEAASPDDATKAKVREFHQLARQELEQQAQWLKQKAVFEQRAAAAPAELEKVTSPPPPETPWWPPPADATIGELEKSLAEAQAEQKRLEELVKQLDDEPQRRNARRLEISKEMPNLKQQITDLEAQLTAEPTPGELPVLTQARKTLIQTRLQARRAQLAAWDAELAAYDAEKELLAPQRTAARAQLGAVTEAVEQLTRLVAERRSNEIERLRDRAMRQLQQVPPALKDDAQQNVQLADDARRLASDLSLAESQAAALRGELSQWQERINKSKRRVEKGRSASSVASLRQDRLLTADRLRRLATELNQRNQQIEQVQEQLDLYQEMLDQVADPAGVAERTARERQFAQSPDEEPALRAALLAILELRRELLLDLVRRQTQYFEQLIEANDTSQDLQKELQDYLLFIDRRILWMRSTDAIGWSTWMHLKDAAYQARRYLAEGLSDSGRWINGVLREMGTHASLYLVLAASVVLLLRYRRAMRHRIVQVGEVALRGNCVRYTPTCEALLLSALISLPLPLTVGVVGWRLQQVGLTWAAGLLSAALAYFAMEFLRQVCRPRGLALAHFGWSDRAVERLRRVLRWYAPAASALTLVVAACHEAAEAWINDSVGRLCFLGLMIITAWAIHRLLSPRHGIFAEYLSYHAGGWADRLSVVWYPGAILGPLVLAGLAAWGYYYTAEQLAMRLAQTGVLLEVLVVAAGMLYRLLLLSRRRLAIQQARQRQQRLQEGVEVEAAEPPMDLAAINQQSQRLVRSLLVLVGLVHLWFIWSDVLPALAVLQQVRLYRIESLEAGAVEWVTLGGLLLASVIGVMTAIAARNIPGLLEIFLLQRLPLDSATRYVLATLSRYAIVLVGIIAVCSTLGITWRRAQWLVAALGVGLGFGLQEIFANFVSGLILLLERPIRVGDIITLGDVTGIVTRIRIRATTVRDWDGKELIVPNKDLITGRLLNWTLTDTKNRVVIKVGIAYGSDVALAQRLLLDIARNHPAVLADPPPMATFEEFGDSALILVLRVYLARLDQRLACIHELHMAIDKAFREHRIEIAFPQMDIHVRNWPPLSTVRET
ncbi:MAG: potassium transporter [Pirellulaceae bacterium]|nr:MAG: potassium transporter [Pirellulaceae bacterium]